MAGSAKGTVPLAGTLGWYVIIFANDYQYPLFCHKHAIIYLLQNSGQIPSLICILPELSAIIVMDVIMDEKN